MFSAFFWSLAFCDATTRDDSTSGFVFNHIYGLCWMIKNTQQEGRQSALKSPSETCLSHIHVSFTQTSVGFYMELHNLSSIDSLVFH